MEEKQLVNNNEAKNNAVFVGDIVELPKFAFETHGRNMYVAKLGCARLSGYVDTIDLVMPEHLVPTFEILADENKNEAYAVGRAKIVGSLRTHAYMSERTKKNAIHVYVFVYDIEGVGEEVDDYNSVNVRGTICVKPSIRETPFGKKVTDFIVAVNTTGNHSDYPPCICWNAVAKRVADLHVGDEVMLSGRYQTREYIKKNGSNVEEKRVAHEFSCTNVVSTGVSNKHTETDEATA